MSLSPNADNDFDFEDEWTDYLEYEEKAIQRGRARQAHRTNKQKANYQAKKSRQEVLNSIADEVDLATDFHPTYLQNFDPTVHEYRWLMKALTGFYQDKLLADVIGIVKAGKEANVYTCTGTAVSGYPLLAAKVYRPRMLRHLRNDAMYKEGRFIRDQSGKEQRGSRVTRALRKKTRYGKDLDFMTWIGHEFEMQKALFAAGADVPEPVAQRGNTIMMDYVGDASRAAPTLVETSLTADEATPLFQRVMDNVRLLLSLNYVHGDLSAYNILYWQGEVTIIDFPQLADARVNNNAFALLERDVQRVYDYFAPYGITADPVALVVGLWEEWLDGRL
jgi:RIO kinase 1